MTDVVVLAEGLLTKTIKKASPDGEVPQRGQIVQVHYTGTLENGSQFDSSRSRGVPLEFPLAAGYVIKGWDLGVASMRVGERAILKIAPQYGYGDAGAGGGVIPGGATLLFDVELVGIKEGTFAAQKNYLPPGSGIVSELRQLLAFVPVRTLGRLLLIAVILYSNWYLFATFRAVK